MGKSDLRESARVTRRAITGEARADKEARIRKAALELPELKGARVVGCYAAVGSEVGTDMLIRELFVRGHVVALPVVVDDRIRFVRLDHPWALVKVAKGAPVPHQPWTDVRGDDIAVLFIPGLQFGRDGSRLGNGGGHFDRFLHDHPNPLRVGLAFAEQVVDHVPVEAHDQGVDVIVTEEGRQRVGRPAKP